VCADGSENGYTIYTYDINPSGRVISEGGGSSIIAIIIFVIVILSSIFIGTFLMLIVVRKRIKNL
ncbi:hypothetical protein LCGC14_0963320, partial [marine sediment metagenome]